MYFRPLIIAFLLLLMWVFGAGSSYDIAKLWIDSSYSLVMLSLAAAVVVSVGQIDVSSASFSSLFGMICLLIWDKWLYSSEELVMTFILSGVPVLLFYGIEAVAISYFGVSSLLLTISFAFIAKGLSVSIQSVIKGDLLPSVFNINTGSLVLPLNNMPSLLSNRLAVTLVVLFLLLAWRYRTLSGLRHVGVGYNAVSAGIAGVRVRRVYSLAFAIAGVLVCLSALISLTGVQQGGWSADTGWGRELIAIAAAVIGGCRIVGGQFAPIGTALAAVLIVSIQDIVDGSALPTEISYLLFGGAILLSISADYVAQLARARKTA